MNEAKGPREIAEEIIDSLLTTYMPKRKGTRLAVKLAHSGDPNAQETDLGGWGRVPAIDRVENVLKQYMP